MTTPIFDQDAINRYTVSRVIDRLAPQLSKIDGIELPFTNQDKFLRAALVKHYPDGCEYSEIPMFIDFFCDKAIEICTAQPEPLTNNKFCIPVETAIYDAKDRINKALGKAQVAATLIAEEVDRQGYFKIRLTEIEATFQNQTANLHLRYELEKKRNLIKVNGQLISKIEAAVDKALSNAMSEIGSTCMDIKKLTL